PRTPRSSTSSGRSDRSRGAAVGRASPRIPARARLPRRSPGEPAGSPPRAGGAEPLRRAPLRVLSPRRLVRLLLAEGERLGGDDARPLLPRPEGRDRRSAEALLLLRIHLRGVLPRVGGVVRGEEGPLPPRRPRRRAGRRVPPGLVRLGRRPEDRPPRD